MKLKLFSVFESSLVLYSSQTSFTISMYFQKWCDTLSEIWCQILSLSVLFIWTPYFFFVEWKIAFCKTSPLMFHKVIQVWVTWGWVNFEFSFLAEEYLHCSLIWRSSLIQNSVFIYSHSCCHKPDAFVCGTQKNRLYFEDRCDPNHIGPQWHLFEWLFWVNYPFNVKH